MGEQGHPRQQGRLPAHLAHLQVGPHTHLHHRNDKSQCLPTARWGRNTEVTGLVAASAHQKPAGHALQDSGDDRSLDWTGRREASHTWAGAPPSTGRGLAVTLPEGPPEPRAASGSAACAGGTRSLAKAGHLGSRTRCHVPAASSAGQGGLRGCPQWAPGLQ